MCPAIYSFTMLITLIFIYCLITEGRLAEGSSFFQNISWAYKDELITPFSGNSIKRFYYYLWTDTIYVAAAKYKSLFHPLISEKSPVPFLSMGVNN